MEEKQSAGREGILDGNDWMGTEGVRGTVSLFCGN